ncbi:MAG: VPDSG-CTERM sorting domain-containing protein [Chthoniobacterales bacterium]
MKHFCIVASLCLLSALAVQATPVTVQELSVSPSKVVGISVTGFYTGNVYAGINNLLVNNVAANGFCIDPFHFSIGGPQPYESVPLEQAPKDDHLITGTHMTTGEAALIGKLWAMAYSDIGSDAERAAAFQIAIWEIVGGSYFHVTSSTDYGASLLLSQAMAYSGPGANLVALTGPGQDYVIGGPSSVPDSGTTAMLLASALGALFVARRFGEPARTEVSERSNPSR